MDDAQSWLEHARWLYEDQRFRFDALGRQATAVLSVAGVLLGLLASGFVATQRGNHGGRWLLVSAIICDLLAAAASVVALTPRRTTSVNIEESRQLWQQSVARRAHGREVGFTDAAGMTESILHGGRQNAATSPGPLAGLAAAVTKRGWTVVASSITLAASIALVGAYLIDKTL
ncbi:hypothetical protein [uncultured Jatrophihabitans sp.]|uniref:hypothetical protein n=1 Tax=uncultured Jatrophihabitans sp. TaxID=1610747 RepID=UPI0035C98BA0